MAPDDFLLTGIEICGRQECPGRCPNHEDSECADDLVCVVQDDSGYWDQCVDCDPKQFQDDCAVWKSQGQDDFLAAAEGKCGLTCDAK